MGRKYEVWFSIWDPVTRKSRETRAKRTFNTLNEAKDYARAVKQRSVWGVTDRDGRIINAQDILHVRFREVWY